jgi:hypothetical protein
MLAPNNGNKGPLKGRATAGGNPQTQSATQATVEAQATPASTTQKKSTNTAPSPRSLTPGLVTTLRLSDTLSSKGANGQLERLIDLATKSAKLEAPLRKFLEEERQANSPHKDAAKLILDRASSFDKRVATISKDDPKKFVWLDVNEKLKAAKTVTVLLELLKEPAEHREPVLAALREWSKPASLVAGLVALFAPSPRQRVSDFSRNLLRDLDTTN